MFKRSGIHLTRKRAILVLLSLSLLFGLAVTELTGHQTDNPATAFDETLLLSCPLTTINNAIVLGDITSVHDCEDQQNHIVTSAHVGIFGLATDPNVDCSLPPFSLTSALTVSDCRRTPLLVLQRIGKNKTLPSPGADPFDSDGRFSIGVAFDSFTIYDDYDNGGAPLGSPFEGPGSIPRFTIDTNGNVGIGIGYPDLSHRLHVRGNFLAESSSGDLLLSAQIDGSVKIGKLTGESSRHVCFNTATKELADCLTDGGFVIVPGNPRDPGAFQIGDLVVVRCPFNPEKCPNPGPDPAFFVEKSSTPCDQNLIGVVGGLESANKTDLSRSESVPLATTGYFPIKVTKENGPVRQGDPITSSSTRGAGMKALPGCKIVGYALTDANQDGTVLLFANLGEFAGASQYEKIKEELDKQAAELAKAKAEAQKNMIYVGLGFAVSIVAFISSLDIL